RRARVHDSLLPELRFIGLLGIGQKPRAHRCCGRRVRRSIISCAGPFGMGAVDAFVVGRTRGRAAFRQRARVVMETNSHKSKVVSLEQLAETLTELWSPRVVGEVDDAYIKVAKVQGSLTWHSHENEDELFLVLKGRLRIEMESDFVDLVEGEMFI